MMDRLENKQRDKLSTLGELATELAHEIKNPMNSIIINLEVLKSAVAKLSENQTSDAGEKAQRYLKVIEGEIKRLEKVISGFLDLAAPNEPTKMRFSINDLIKNLVEFLSIDFKQKSIEIVTDFNSELPNFTGSSDQLKQAFLNLMLNAAQAMSEGGCLKIGTGFDDKTLWISFQDDGEGIDEAIMTRIFSPYFTTKKKGSGLGLAIVRRIAREHGGYIDVHSEKGKGSEFKLVLPRNIEV